MYRLPHYSAGRTLLMCLTGLAIGALTVNVLIADNLKESMGDLPKEKLIAASALLFAIGDIWAQKRKLDEEKRASDRFPCQNETDSINNCQRTLGLHPGAISINDINDINDNFNEPLLSDEIKREDRFVVNGVAFKTLEDAFAYQQITKKEREASDYLSRQGELFDRQLPELLLKYKGMYVFFEDGEVKDADFDEEALINRVLTKEGYRDIFVEKVI